MKLGSWIALITLGCYCVLSSYSIGAYHPDAKPEKVYAAVAKPVKLWSANRKPTRLERAVLQANGHTAPDRVAFTGSQKREECGEDWLCLAAWAERRR